MKKTDPSRMAAVRDYALANPKVPYAEIAKIFGLSEITVKRFCHGLGRGKNWKLNQNKIQDPEQFWASVERGEPDKCWPWQGAPNSAGYGCFYYDGKNRPAHVVAYLLSKGEIPDGTELDHTCRNRACCNPGHLEPVTHKENMRRARAARAVIDTTATVIETQPEQGAPFGPRVSILRIDTPSSINPEPAKSEMEPVNEERSIRLAKGPVSITPAVSIAPVSIAPSLSIDTLRPLSPAPPALIATPTPVSILPPPPPYNPGTLLVGVFQPPHYYPPVQIKGILEPRNAKGQVKIVTDPVILMGPFSKLYRIFCRDSVSWQGGQPEGEQYRGEQVDNTAMRNSAKTLLPSVVVMARDDAGARGLWKSVFGQGLPENGESLIEEVRYLGLTTDAPRIALWEQHWQEELTFAYENWRSELRWQGGYRFDEIQRGVELAIRQRNEDGWRKIEKENEAMAQRVFEQEMYRQVRPRSNIRIEQRATSPQRCKTCGSSMDRCPDCGRARHRY